ncbi:hypothetical protein [Anabaena sp. CCY 0017]|uniref:hypothetical protein n=1 Tax=Anabaena sp. CCY 0017 TaxID=3103866 RepID=UPI0039C68BFE
MMTARMSEVAVFCQDLMTCKCDLLALLNQSMKCQNYLYLQCLEQWQYQLILLRRDNSENGDRDRHSRSVSQKRH